MSYKNNWPAVNADWDVIMGLIGAHLMQHVQNGRDGVWYTMIWPVDIMQLFYSVARLWKKKYKVYHSHYTVWQTIF